MRIIARVSFVGKNMVGTPGEELECAKAVAEDLIAAGYAVASESRSRKTTAKAPKGEEKDEGK